MSLRFESIRRVYFIGIGGIGMSALARYFVKQGKEVAGYDRTQTALTLELESEGILIHYDDDIHSIPVQFRSEKEDTLVVYTPAVPIDHTEYQYYKNHGFRILKRAQALGVVAQAKRVAAVAGTHGKTSTTTMLAHLLNNSVGGCDAFLGGISKNFMNNLVLADRGSNILVVEADEFDRSFLNLYSHLAIITSVDADHLDIYETPGKVLEAYLQFASQLEENGIMIINKNINIHPFFKKGVKTFSYSIIQEADYCISDLCLKNGFYQFTLKTPGGVIPEIRLGVPGLYNVENAVAASAAALSLGLSPNELRLGLESFKGVSRRFDIMYRGKKTVYVDDYAHHPEEIKATISSARNFFPGRNLTGIFQPHLYSRTRDFADDFARSLDLLDQVFLLDIYPAREEPIPGISSDTILRLMKNRNVKLYKRGELLEFLNHSQLDVLITMGAGDIDKMVGPIVEILTKREV